MKNLKPILWSIGTILIIASSIIVQISIPIFDTKIEGIDLNTSELNDEIEGIDYQFNENKVKYIELSDSNYAIKILSNLPQNEKLNYSIYLIKINKFIYYSQIILPMMRINGDNTDYFTDNLITNNESENPIVDVSNFSEYLISIGEEKTYELYMDQFIKLRDKKVKLKHERAELNKQKDELFEKKKEIFKFSSYFQMLGFICISVGEFIGLKYKEKPSNEPKT